MLVPSTDNGQPGQIGLRVPKLAQTESRKKETLLGKLDQELALTLQLPMVAMIAKAAKMTLIFATRTLRAVSKCLLLYFMVISKILEVYKSLL